MLIGSLRFEFRLHAVYSLKEKRSISNRLKQKLRNKFNIAVSEVEQLESLSHLVLVVVTVANEQRKVESRLSKASAMLEAISTEEVYDISMEIFGA